MKLPALRIPPLNPYYRASLVLICAAIVLVLIAILTDRRDLTSAALVIAGLVCLITGIFLATLSGAEPLDTGYVSLLPVQGCINLCRVCADLGITGSAVFLPGSGDRQHRVMQFIPTSAYNGVPPTGDSFVTTPGSSGLLVVPAAGPLLAEIVQRHQLVVPPDVPALPDLIREVGVDLLEVADRVTTDRGTATITVSLEGYRLIGGCMAVQKESPRCCLVNPCPICSLVACLLVEGTGSVIQVERCSPDEELRSVTMVFSLVPSS
ncbi:MAG: hypothetical protein ABSG49_11685 [Methanoregula sp.]|jgi:hypothetical protein|uniref:hypothetical protein n=1 Tax=Methanoregula sp. TaxID=2052170 RepID=UPI003C18048E